MIQLSDEEIVARLRNGETRLFPTLIGRYRDRGFSLALRILRNTQDAEEALQDAFVRAYNGIAKFEGTSAFGTWFYRILYNVCMSALARRKQVSIFAEPGEGDLPDPGPEPELPGDYSGFEMRDLVSRVESVVSRMPAKYASIISMFYVQELTYAEIADVTGLPAGTVKTHLFRARLLLQKEMHKELNQDTVIV